MEKTEDILTYEQRVLQVPQGVRFVIFRAEATFFWGP
jgi:hypothetical protein